MKTYGVAGLLSLALEGLLLGQAVMSPPVVKSTPDEIQFSVRFSNFVQGENYRIGVGTAEADLEKFQLKLFQGAAELNHEVATFEQGFTRSWFGVDKISVQGYLFPSDRLPAGGEELIMRVSVPRPEAERVKRLFVILVRQYGPNRWYIEDGSELNDSVW